MKVVEIILEILGWLMIVLGTIVPAALIAFLIYSKWTNKTGETISLILIAIGFIAGAIWATKIWKRSGTIAWLSRINRIS